MSILSCGTSEVSSSDSSSAGGGEITVAVEVCLSSGDAALEWRMNGDSKTIGPPVAGVGS